MSVSRVLKVALFMAWHKLTPQFMVWMCLIYCMSYDPLLVWTGVLNYVIVDMIVL